jgi:hypothetical protein
VRRQQRQPKSCRAPRGGFNHAYDMSGLSDACTGGQMVTVVNGGTVKRTTMQSSDEEWAGAGVDAQTPETDSAVITAQTSTPMRRT